jgi:hypothetical protein
MDAMFAMWQLQQHAHKKGKTIKRNKKSGFPLHTIMVVK